MAGAVPRHYVVSTLAIFKAVPGFNCFANPPEFLQEDACHHMVDAEDFAFGFAKIR